jgi:hypothetical protein
MRRLSRPFRLRAFPMSYGEVPRLTNEDPLASEPILFECDRQGCGGRRWLRRSGSLCTGVEGRRHSPPSPMEAIRDDGNGENPRAILTEDQDYEGRGLV